MLIETLDSTKTGRLPAVLFSLLLLATVSSAQTLVTDKADYLPGETVYFAGSGFQAGEEVAMSIHVETHNDKVIDYAIGGIDVDAAGEFAATWLVPGEALQSVIRATAMGLASRRVAEVSFTDDQIPMLATMDLVGGNVLVRVVLMGASGVTITSVKANVSLLGLITLHRVSVLGVTETWEGTAFSPPCGETLELDSVHVRACILSIICDTRIQSAAATVTTAPCPACLVNAPPIIACDDLELDDIVGCLADGFSESVTVSATDFTCTVTDPDGDPVTLTFLGPSDVTLVGPGEAEATVTFSATDDPSGRQAESTCPLVPATTTQTASVRARIVYDFEGPLAPLEPNVATLKKAGSVIPIKFRLRDCAGTEICPSNLPSIGLDANKPRLEAQAVTVISPTGDAPVEAPGSFDCVPDQLISHEGNCGTGQWSYNLTTKGGLWTAGLTYRANIMLDDGTVHPVFFSLKK